MSFRWFVPNDTGGVYLVAEHYNGAWHVTVTNAASQPVTDEQRHNAIEEVMRELSSLRSHLWHDELQNPRVDPDGIVEK